MDEAEAARFPVVALGGSAGALDVFEAFFDALGEQAEAPGIAFIVLLHLPPDTESHLAQLLRRHSRLPVVDIADETVIQPDHVYVLPPGRTVRIEGDRLRSQARGEAAVPHPIDDLFASLGPARGERAAAVILSGGGANGSAGLKAVREHGGLVLAQSPESAEQTSMPRSAIATGLVDRVLEPVAMVSLILDWARGSRAAVVDHAEDACRAILATLRAHTGLDFAQYKPGTLKRRIERRVHLNRLPDIEAYAAFLRERPAEREALFDDLLITVTSFFRDGEAWEALRAQVVRPLVERLNGHAETVRAWVAGCASGEEAYSLGILFLEETRALDRDPGVVEIFATDASEAAFERARRGLYPAADVAHLPEAWREAYFERVDDHVRVRPLLRERVVFAPHDVIADPPFSRIDLIVCRNLQIYLRPEIQERLAHIFHFALRQGGYLFLGNAETVGDDDLFTPVCGAWRIFRRIGAARHDMLDFSAPRERQHATGRHPPARRPPEPGHKPLVERALTALADRFAPPSVIVDQRLDILYYQGATERFLRVRGGEPTHNLVALAREGVGARVRRLVDDAGTQQTPQSARVRMAEDGGEAVVDLEVAPIDQDGEGALFRVSFTAEPASSTPASDQATLDREQELEAEIRFLREENAASVERANRAQEELKSYNEEVISMNEELRAANEELQTSKEELQSLNEELKTVNRQLRDKVDELHERTADLDNLLRSSDVATLFLDGDLNIRWFAPGVVELFSIRESDVGRPIGDLVQRFTDERFVDDCRRVLRTLEPATREVTRGDDRWFVRRIQPYRTGDGRIDGVVVTFSDVTAVQTARRYAERIVEAVPLPLLVLDTELRVVSTNPAFCATFDVSPEGTTNRLVYSLGNGQWNIPELRRLLEEVLPHDSQFHGFDVEHVFESVGRKVMKLNGRRLDHVQLILLAIEDVTEERDLFARLRESEERARVLVETLTIGSWEADPSGEMALDAKSWCALTGRSEEELRGDGWLDVVHPDDRERIVRRWKAAVAKGEVSDDEFRILDATGRYRWTYTHAAPLLDEAGRVRKWAGMIIDISARKAAEEERELLLGELEHRVKNLFAVIRALANQQGQGETRDAAADRRVFLERLDALMRSHDLALAGDWQSVDLTRLARDAVEPYRPDDGERLVIDGAPVRIAPRTAQSLSLVLNELATNAIKYGALSVPEGRVELRWWVETSDGERRVRLRWTERGGPPVEPPERPSFGTRLIRRAFASEPGGGAELDFAADGVRFDASFPAL